MKKGVLCHAGGHGTVVPGTWGVFHEENCCPYCGSKNITIVNPEMAAEVERIGNERGKNWGR